MVNVKEHSFLYIINYQSQEEELCYLEMKYIFNQQIKEKHFFSEKKVDPARSPFIRHRIEVLYRANSLEKLIRTLQSNEVTYNDFKFATIKIKGGEIGHEEWNSVVSSLCEIINGEINMENPKTILGVVKIDGNWIFGEYKKNDNKWREHNKKPTTYSQSLNLITAKALVNIAIGDNLKSKLIDPCCGVGTVVIEAISMGVNTKGYEINWKTARNAMNNLAFFGYENVITIGDMHEIIEHYDTAIIDIPYGLFGKITLAQQTDIINTARRIADKLVIITFEDMDNLLIAAGFEIVDFCQIDKGRFKRYISVCK